MEKINELLGDNCYPQEIFLDQFYLKQLICPIDSKVIKTPIIDSCGHTYGENCFKIWYKNNLTCFSTKLIPKDGNYEQNILVSNLMNDLRIKCLNFDRNCNWQGILIDLELHLKDECLFTKVECEKCNENIIRNDIKIHLELQCPFTLIECPFENFCSKTIIRTDLAKHFVDNHLIHIKEILKQNKSLCDDNNEKERLTIENCKLRSENERFTKDYNSIINENEMLKNENKSLKQRLEHLEASTKTQNLKIEELTISQGYNNNPPFNPYCQQQENFSYQNSNPIINNNNNNNINRDVLSNMNCSQQTYQTYQSNNFSSNNSIITKNYFDLEGHANLINQVYFIKMLFLLKCYFFSYYIQNY